MFKNCHYFIKKIAKALKRNQLYAIKTLNFGVLKKNVKQNIQKKLLYIQNIANLKNEPDICNEKIFK
tara:strand:+ start:1009 stop:1209 length:201 start_codon:yes stop_codon:yes gene_type:complete